MEAVFQALLPVMQDDIGNVLAAALPGLKSHLC